MNLTSIALDHIEETIFKEVVEATSERFGLEVQKPYNNGYLEFYRNGKKLGGINPQGTNLLYNCKRLAEELHSLLP